MAEHEYMQTQIDIRPGGSFEVALAANTYAKQGWRLVTTVPVKRHRNHESDMLDLVFERVKQAEPNEGEPAIHIDYELDNLVDLMRKGDLRHNHPPGKGCGPTCPVLKAWNAIGEGR